MTVTDADDSMARVAVRRLRVPDGRLRALGRARSGVAAGRGGRRMRCAAFVARRGRRRRDTAALPLRRSPRIDEPRRLGVARRAVRRVPAQPVANRASRAQGRALARHRRARRSPSGRPRDVRAVRAQPTAPRTIAPVFGRRARARCGVDRATTTQRLFLFGVRAARCRPPCAWASSARYDAQRLQAERGARSRSDARTLSLALTIDDAAQTAPLDRPLQASHDRLYSRLFQS